MGFAIHDQTQHDVDDDIDIDGEDEAVYGEAQFTEGDVLNPLLSNRHNEDEDVDVDVDADEDEDTTQSPGASGSSRRLDVTVQGLAAEGKLLKRSVPSDSASHLDVVKQAVEEVMGVDETEQLDRAVELARHSGNKDALVEALQNKVKMLVSDILLSSDAHPNVFPTGVDTSVVRDITPVQDLP